MIECTRRSADEPNPRNIHGSNQCQVVINDDYYSYIFIIHKTH